MVCLEYVDEAFASSPLGPRRSLFPADLALKAKVRIGVEWVKEQVIPFYYRCLMSQDAEGRQAAMTKLLAGLETLSTQHMEPQGPFFSGKDFGFFECTFLPWFQRMHVILAHYRGFALPDDAPWVPRLKKWFSACRARDSFASTMADEAKLVANNIGYANNTGTSVCAQNTRAGAGIQEHRGLKLGLGGTTGRRLMVVGGSLALALATWAWVSFSFSGGIQTTRRQTAIPLEIPRRLARVH